MGHVVGGGGRGRDGRRASGIGDRQQPEGEGAGMSPPPRAPGGFVRVDGRATPFSSRAPKKGWAGNVPAPRSWGGGTPKGSPPPPTPSPPVGPTRARERARTVRGQWGLRGSSRAAAEEEAQQHGTAADARVVRPRGRPRQPHWLCERRERYDAVQTRSHAAAQRGPRTLFCWDPVKR